MPMLGLAGTVFGMIRSFASLSSGEPTPSGLADGISFSMQSTAIGIIVGVVAALIGGALLLVGARRETG